MRHDLVVRMVLVRVVAFVEYEERKYGQGVDVVPQGVLDYLRP